MDVDVSNIQHGNVATLAMAIYHAKLKVMDITIDGFKFQCNALSGEVTRTWNRNGSIISIMGEHDAESYLFEIKRAISLAAKIHLLMNIKKIPDDALAAIIMVDVEANEHVDENAVNGMLKRLLQMKIFANFSILGLFTAQVPMSMAQLAVQQSLMKIGIHNILGFTVADHIYQTINSLLSARTPTPPIR